MKFDPVHVVKPERAPGFVSARRVVLLAIVAGAGGTAVGALLGNAWLSAMIGLDRPREDGVPTPVDARLEHALRLANSGLSDAEALAEQHFFESVLIEHNADSNAYRSLWMMVARLGRLVADLPPGPDQRRRARALLALMRQPHPPGTGIEDLLPSLQELAR